MSSIREEKVSSVPVHFPDFFECMGVTYEKVSALRYGTNPHQPAAFYRPVDRALLVLGQHRVLKQGKGGLSQTNLEDMHGALSILKYMTGPAVAVMKHVNPCGVAISRDGESLHKMYLRARECDPQSAFGSVVGFNRPVDQTTAEEIMSSVVECVIAPGYDEGVMAIFRDTRRFGRNRNIRIVEIPDPDLLPRFVGDDTGHCREIKVLGDGSLVIAAPYLSKIRTPEDLRLATVTRSPGGLIHIDRPPTAQEARNLLFSWYIAISVRSSAMVVTRNGTTLAIGAGQQTRLGALEQAVDKYQRRYRGSERIEGAVLASDGFIPFRDTIDLAARVGISAIVQPGGSLRDDECIEACNEHGIAMVFTGERCFSHH